jgi:hypothetical protein
MVVLIYVLKIDTICELLAAPNAIVADASGGQIFLKHKTDFFPHGSSRPNNQGGGKAFW